MCKKKNVYKCNHSTFVIRLCLQLLVNRSKRKRRRRRADKALTGSEKVKIIHMRTGKKVRADSPSQRCLFLIKALILSTIAINIFQLVRPTIFSDLLALEN